MGSHFTVCENLTLREKSPYSKFLWSVFSIFGMNMDQKNFEYGLFLRSAMQ